MACPQSVTSGECRPGILLRYFAVRRLYTVNDAVNCEGRPTPRRYRPAGSVCWVAAGPNVSTAECRFPRCRAYAVIQIQRRVWEALYAWASTNNCRLRQSRSCWCCFSRSSFGLEREEHKAAGGSYFFGGVRTFPLIGLIGYSLALISGTQLLPLTIGFLVVAGFLLLSYWHKLTHCARHDCRRDHGDVGPGHVSGGRAGLLRAFLDCHHAGRRQPAAARSESGAGEAGRAHRSATRFSPSPSFCF